MKNIKELSKTEMRLIEGGDTTFAYDVGTLFRMWGQIFNGAGLAATAGLWAAQQ